MDKKGENQCTKNGIAAAGLIGNMTNQVKRRQQDWKDAADTAVICDFISREDIVAGLEDYLKQLQAETKAVEERVSEMKKSKQA
jgi:hypothetical protein